MGVAPSRKLEKHATAQPNPTEQQPQQSTSPKPNKKPHNFHEIVGEDISDELDSTVRSTTGIFLAEKTKKYWVDGESNNCFTIFPRGMSIIWGDDPRYWAWKTLGEAGSDTCQIEVAELLNVCWLEVHGKLQMSYLNPEVAYEVILEVKLKDTPYGWRKPVDLQLKLPDGSVQERKVILDNKPKNSWLPLMVGEIQAQREQDNGDVVVSLFQHGGHWKSGLVIKGIIIRTK